MLARFVLEASFYDPMSHLHDVTAPVLLRGALQDKICPIAAVREAAALLPRATLIEINATHLQAHRHGLDPAHLRPVVAFLTDHLLTGAAAAATSA